MSDDNWASINLALKEIYSSGVIQNALYVDTPFLKIMNRMKDDKEEQAWKEFMEHCETHNKDE
jgi:DNA-binding MltR family transcriptional regulator